PVLAPGELSQVQNALGSITVREELLAYIVELIRRTRTHESVLVGAGPRATQALVLASRAAAAIDGRDFVTPDDVKSLSLPVLTHRLSLRPEYEIEGLTIPEVILQLLDSIPVPR
ncbi:MAG: MoxR family ATPase, partial [Verrucomicrobiae bacterium]|nr:MoxR family ATPase [Verrucomicrobiae bacterium]